jgi:hypothetical protein
MMAFPWIPIRARRLLHPSLTARSTGSIDWSSRAPKGRFPEQVSTRTWELHLHMDAAPQSVTVNGTDAGPVSWDAARSTAVLKLPAMPIVQRAEVVWH